MRFDDSSGVHNRGSLHHGIESIDGVCGVQDGTDETIGFHQAVAALHDVPVAGLMLALCVAGQCVADVVCERVLGVGVVVCANHYSALRNNQHDAQHQQYLNNNQLLLNKTYRVFQKYF